MFPSPATMTPQAAALHATHARVAAMADRLREINAREQQEADEATARWFDDNSRLTADDVDRLAESLGDDGADVATAVVRNFHD